MKNLRFAPTERKISFIVYLALLFGANAAFAQAPQYQRPVVAPTTTPNEAKKTDSKKSDAAAKNDKLTPEAQKPDSDRLDISDLEQKYWAPKDTDFSVVQNRTYTKSKRWAANFMFGPSVNNRFSEGYAYGLGVNYYFDERIGVQLQYVKADLKDNEVTKNFKTLSSGGNVSPDFNRLAEYYSLGFNFVPFYAKMSFLNKKIIYFDMQMTPHIGFLKYEQQREDASPIEKSAFSYGIDITQFFFFAKNLAFRVDLQNRWSEQEIRSFLKSKQYKKIKNDTEVDTTLLMGLTVFF